MGKPKDVSRIVQPTPGLHEAVSGVAADDLDAAVRLLTKQERQQAMSLVDARVHAALSSQARPPVLHMADHDVRSDALWGGAHSFPTQT